MVDPVEHLQGGLIVVQGLFQKVLVAFLGVNAVTDLPHPVLQRRPFLGIGVAGELLGRRFQKRHRLGHRPGGFVFVVGRHLQGFPFGGQGRQDRAERALRHGAVEGVTVILQEGDGLTVDVGGHAVALKLSGRARLKRQQVGEKQPGDGAVAVRDVGGRAQGFDGRGRVFHGLGQDFGKAALLDLGQRDRRRQGDGRRQGGQGRIRLGRQHQRLGRVEHPGRILVLDAQGQEPQGQALAGGIQLEADQDVRLDLRQGLARRPMQAVRAVLGFRVLREGEGLLQGAGAHAFKFGEGVENQEFRVRRGVAIGVDAFRGLAFGRQGRNADLDAGRVGGLARLLDLAEPAEQGEPAAWCPGVRRGQGGEQAGQQASLLCRRLDQGQGLLVERAQRHHAGGDRRRFVAAVRDIRVAQGFARAQNTQMLFLAVDLGHQFDLAGDDGEGTGRRIPLAEDDVLVAELLFPAVHGPWPVR